MTNLFLFLPTAILLMTGLIILIVRQVRPGIGYAWLIAAVGALVSVGASLFLRWRLPLQLSIDQWRLFGDFSNPLVFVLDSYSWSYVFSLSVVALAFIWTDAARLETEAKPLNWVTGFVITAVVLLALMAGNPLTLITVWTTIDLLELVVVLGTAPGRRMGQQTVTAFAVRVMATVMVIVAMLLARNTGIEATFLPVPEPLAFVLLLATGLRLGVLPLNIPYVREVYVWRGLGNVVRLIGPVSALVVLGRMPVNVVPVPWQPFLLTLTALAALYGSAMFLTAENELNGRPYWVIALAALGIACVLNGQAQSSIAWGVALILVGSVLFLFSARRRRSLFFAVIGMLGLSGLPFLPAAAGWQGLFGVGFTAAGVVFFLSLVLLEWGYLRHFLRPREELYRMERWVHTVYPAGLAALFLAQAAVGILGWTGSFTIGIWQISAALAVVIILGLAAVWYFRSLLSRGVLAFRWVQILLQWLGKVLGAFFRLNWLYRTLLWFYRLIQRMVLMITVIFEGEGGVLWTLVILALLVSLLWSGTIATGGAP